MRESGGDFLLNLCLLVLHQPKPDLSKPDLELQLASERSSDEDERVCPLQPLKTFPPQILTKPP